MFGHVAHAARGVDGSRYASGGGKTRLDLCEEEAKRGGDPSYHDRWAIANLGWNFWVGSFCPPAWLVNRLGGVRIDLG
jgi:hypothetical protein